MKTWLIGVAITAVLMIASGVLQGKLSNRWGPSDSLQQAGKKIETIPQKFPKDIPTWEMVKSDVLGQESINQLQPAGYVVRTYRNCHDNSVVNVMIIVGMTGPIAVHTPEICYGGRNHELIAPREKIQLSCPTGGEETAWKTTFRLKGIDAKKQYVYYAWSSGDHWAAAERPRFTYAMKPYLYKIQLDSLSEDAGVQFLNDFLPVLQPYLQTSSTN